MAIDPLNDQMQFRDGELPIDRLRNGSMTDAEILRVAADTLIYHVGPNDPDPIRETFHALARRLKLVRLLEPQQTRARSLYIPKPKPDGGRIHA
jgi:hypothetical protein